MVLLKKDQQVVVYDFGGGTFDVSVLDIGEDTVEVKATGGDTHLGGEDFDNRIVSWIIEEFKKDQGIDLSQDKLALQRLKESAEKAKIELSTSLETEINIPFITSDATGPKHLLLKLTRATLENLVKDYLDKSFKIVIDVLKEAKIKPEEVDAVVLVGGQTRMPKIQSEVKKIFGKEPNKEINPDEVVAIGAAIESGILQGDVKDVLLLDVTPLSLGIETLGGVMTRLIEANTTIPTRKSEVFSTASDNQPSVEINILQGERPMAADNRTLGRFHLDGIPPAPRGMPQIEVTFDIDANGILHVAAKDKATGKEQSIRITSSSGLNKDEVEKMKREASEHAAEDKKKRELVDIKNQADSIVFQTKKQMDELKDKIPGEIKVKLEAEVKKVEDSIPTNNTETIKAAIDSLNKVWNEISQNLYSQQGAPGAGQPNPADFAQGSPNPEPSATQDQKEKEVQDASYTVVDDDKK